MQTKLFQAMTADERLQWATQFGEYLRTEWPQLEVAARQKNVKWTLELQRTMERLIKLLMAWSFARDFCEKAVRYGDYAARAYRMPVYIEKVLQLLEQQGDADVMAIIRPQEPEKRKPGRPASAATLAKREAERKAAQQQVEMFKPAGEPAGTVAHSGDGSVRDSAAFTPEPSPMGNDGGDYRLPIAQKRMLLSADLAKRTEDIRTLRGQMAAAAEKAKTLAELNRPQKEIEAAAKESIEANDAVQAIFAEIDTELAVTWYRLQNDSDEWRKQWLTKHGFVKFGKAPSGSAADILPDDLKHDLRKHYQKVQSPEFDLRCRTLIEQESPEYVARQKAEAEKKKEVQDIIRYFKRKDKGQKLETGRAKFKRLEELLGKKEAADYKPLLTKIEEDAKKK